MNTLRMSIVLTLALALGLFALPAQGGEMALERARDHLRQQGTQLGLQATDLDGLVTTDQVVSKASGVTHVYLGQSLDGIRVHNAAVHVAVAPDGRVVISGNRLVAGLDGRAVRRAAGLTAREAVEIAAADRGLVLDAPLELQSGPIGPSRLTRFDGAGISIDPISAELVYHPTESNELPLAWNVVIHEPGTKHWWTVHVDAHSGVVLFVGDYVVNEAPADVPADFIAPLDGVAELPARSQGGVAGSYDVFPIPVESPNHGAQTVVVGPADALASPFGWHDINGVAGAEFTTTRGNNVNAQEDLDANNTGGFRPNGGAGLAFSFAFDPLLGPLGGTNLQASIVNLFYWNNVIHDVLYSYGFDEASGNFQFNNYGRGGVGGDPVQADAVDGSGTNNANFATPPDGSAPRMQMFVWTSPFENVLQVTSPATIAADYIASGAGFGPGLDAVGIAGNLVLADDGTGVTTDACEPLINAAEIAGNIALIDRLDCTFVIKVANAQTAGATAVVIANNVPGPPIPLGGTDASIVIPSGMISLADGNTIKAELGAGVQATLRNAGNQIPARDSDFDNAIIVHEYAHGVSNRLTGGPSTTACLFNQEQMGEGWSDFLAIALTADANGTAGAPRGVGTYVRYQETDGPGIRPAPYTRDMSVNPYTYANRADSDISVPHGLGFIWSSMLWDMYWNLVDIHGFNPDIYGDHTSGGNNLAVQLVLDGLKLQPCTPGFVDGRNAILLADSLLTGGANECAIWDAFTRRGLGAYASQGSSGSRTDGAPSFVLPTQCGGPTPLFRVNYLTLQQGSLGGGSFTFLDDLSFVNAQGAGGTWWFQAPSTLWLRYQGAACDALYVGGVQATGRINGLWSCQDGSGGAGLWFGQVAAGVDVLDVLESAGVPDTEP